jgi:hypothetical protein
MLRVGRTCADGDVFVPLTPSVGRSVAARLFVRDVDARLPLADVAKGVDADAMSATPDQAHAALRELEMANGNMKAAQKNYRDFPSDPNAADYIHGWKALRAAVDRLVALDAPTRKEIEDRATSQAEGT